MVFRSVSFAAMLLLLSLSTVALAQVDLPDCIDAGDWDATTDYFDSIKFQPADYSISLGEADLFAGNMVETDTTTDLFSITYHNSYKIVTNHFVNKTYLLYLCGTKEAIPQEEMDGRHHLVLQVPHTGGIAITQTTQIPFLEMLGLRRQVIGYIGDPQWISSPCMKRLTDQEESTLEVVFNSDDPYNSTTNALLTNAFLEENPDAIIIGGPYGFADGDRTVIAAATQERTTVATFDWIGYYAAFFNLEGEANKISAKAKSRFDCASSNSAMLSADIEADARPTVLWATYFQGYNWSIAECPSWNSAYYCEYAHHCGANIISRPEGFGFNDQSFGGNYWYVDDEQLLELGKDADYFIYPSNTWDSVYAEKKEILDQIKAVQNKQVFDSQGRGPNAWHEQRLAEYDVVALDFCEIVGTTGVPHELQWLRNIETDPIGSLPACSYNYQIDEPHVAQGAQCKLLTTSASASISLGVTALLLSVAAAIL